MRTMNEILCEAYGGQESIFATVMAEMARFGEEAGAVAAGSWGEGAKYTGKGGKGARPGENYFAVSREEARQTAIVRWSLNWEKKVLEGTVEYRAPGAGWKRPLWLEWSEATPRGLGEHVATMLEARGAE